MEMASDQVKEYILKTGSHTWIDGVTYGVGDKMQLTHEQMERIGKERFVGQTPDDVSTADLDALREENKRLKELLAAVTKTTSATAETESESVPVSKTESYTDFLNRPIPDVSADLQSINDISVLNAIQAEESKGGQPRVGVLKAINQRREELSR